MKKLQVTCEQPDADSDAHSPKSHSSHFFSVGQSLPPVVGSWVICRNWPLAQCECSVTPHLVHSPNSDTMQFLAQSSSLQFSDRVSTGHALPSELGIWIADLVRERFPPPQVAEHADQLLHSLTSQSTAHSLVLHGLSLSSKGHLPPYFISWVTWRVRTVTPPPQLLEHSLQAPHSDTVQSTGQCGTSQSAVSDSDGHV